VLFISWIEIHGFGEVIIYQLYLIITIPIIENNFRTINNVLLCIMCIDGIGVDNNIIKMQQMWQRFNNNIVSYITTHIK